MNTEINSAIGEGTTMTDESTAYLLEQHLNQERLDDPAGWANDQLGEFKLSIGAKSLIDRAIDSTARSTGAGLNDENARMETKARAEFLSACGNDLNIALVSLSESVEDPDEGASQVYQLLYSVLKSAVFTANLDLRRFLDPDGDRELPMYIDRRENHSPLEGQSGHATAAENNLEYVREFYGSDAVSTYEEGGVIISALNDVRWYFQLLSESFGWSLDRPMPFGNTQEKDGTYTPITDAVVALDLTEVRTKASRAKKAAARSSQMAAAAQRARELLLKRASRGE